MPRISGIMAPGSGVPSSSKGSDAASSFTRAYQACENCRRKKQKCNLGDPASPNPPCQTCRRANLRCVLPERKRKGRPPRQSLTKVINREPNGLAIDSSNNATSKSPDTVNRRELAPRPAWESSVGTGDNASPDSPCSASGLSQKRLSYDQQLASQTLATFPLRNTSDAIRLLDQAKSKSAADQANNVPYTEQHSIPDGLDMSNMASSRSRFFLLQEGFIDETTLVRLFSFYIGSVHPIMPLIPYKRIQTTPEHILMMASREPHFMAAILVVSASLVGDQALHNRLWQRVQILFAEVAMKGSNASLEVVEGLILLSEYPPNMGHDTGLAFEDRMSWMTVGTAVRLGYFLGLERLGMQAEDVDGKPVQDRDRGKVAWSYCFCLDRQISVRVGKVFWHRSPGMTYHHLHPDPADDFPEMRDIPGIQDDYASYLHCLVHLTHVLSNAHDMLYPSRSRMVALAKAEHYYKYFDEFTETLSSFRNRWQKKLWRAYPINECVWILFHHLRLYIYSFSLQAYMQRVSSGNNGNHPLDYFPAGLMACSDARFIIEAINAAADVLRLAIGRLQPSGTMPYLPLRFFLYFSHAGVFLLKAAVIVPLPASQKRATLRLIRALTKCMSTSSSDPNHPGVRYSFALDSLLDRIYRDQDLQTPAPTHPTSPRMDSDACASANWTESTDVNPAPGQNDLPALLGNREAAFVAERPFQDLAADIDELFGVAPADADIELQTAADNSDLSGILPPCDSFASLFSNDDREFWEQFTSATLG